MSDDKSNQQGSEVSSKPVAHKALRLAAVITILAIAGGIGLGLWFNRPQDTKEETAAALEAAETASKEKKLALLKEAYAEASTSEGKAQAAYYLATYYAKESNHKLALRYYQRADSYYAGKNIDIILGVASNAAEAEEKEIAKEYYQKAIDYYKSRAEAGEDVGWLIAEFQDRIDRL